MNIQTLIKKIQVMIKRVLLIMLFLVLGVGCSHGGEDVKKLSDYDKMNVSSFKCDIPKELSVTCNPESPVIVKSPDGEIKLILLPQPETSSVGGIHFSVYYQDRNIILPSTIQVISEEIDFSSPWSVIKVEKETVDTQWTTRFG